MIPGSLSTWPAPKVAPKCTHTIDALPGHRHPRNLPLLIAQCSNSAQHPTLHPLSAPLKILTAEVKPLLPRLPTPDRDPSLATPPRLPLPNSHPSSQHRSLLRRPRNPCTAPWCPPQKQRLPNSTTTNNLGSRRPPRSRVDLHFLRQLCSLQPDNLLREIRIYNHPPRKL